MLAAEPDTKRGRDQPKSSKGSQYCVYHDLHTHNTIVKSSEPCEKEGSAVAPTTVTGATIEEEEGTQDAGKTAARAKGGAIDLTRIAGKTRRARETGGISLVRIARKATQASLRCRARSPASWAGLKPQPLNASSSSSPAK